MRYAGDALDERAGERAGENCVGQGRGERAVAGKSVGKSEDVVVERVQAALVALRQKLGFIGSHVHLDRTLGFACFATEAEVEGLVDGLALETFVAQGSGEHLPQQVGAAARGVLLLACGAIAGAHDAALRVAAGAYANAALGGALEGAIVPFEDEVRFPGSPVRASRGTRVHGMTQILRGVVDAHGIGELAGIHAVVGVPERLELAEGLDELGAEHFGQESGAGLAVAVFAGERAAEGTDDFGGAVDELAEVFHPIWSSEIEIDAGVHAALAVVAVERAAVAVFGHQRFDGAQIVAKLRGRNGGIVPAFPAFGLAGNKDRSAESGFADMPDGGGLSGRADAGDGRGGPGLRGAGDGFGLVAGLFGAPCAHFDEQKAAAGRKVIEVFEREALAAHEIDEHGIEAFETDGLVLEGERDGVGGEKRIVETEHGEDAEGRAGGEVERGGDDVGAGALRADQRAGHVEVVFGQQLVEVVAGDAARNAGKLFRG